MFTLGILKSRTDIAIRQNLGIGFGRSWVKFKFAAGNAAWPWNWPYWLGVWVSYTNMRQRFSKEQGIRSKRTESLTSQFDFWVSVERSENKRNLR